MEKPKKNEQEGHIKERHMYSELYGKWRYRCTQRNREVRFSFRERNKIETKCNKRLHIRNDCNRHRSRYNKRFSHPRPYCKFYINCTFYIVLQINFLNLKKNWGSRNVKCVILCFHLLLGIVIKHFNHLYSC